MGVLGNFDHERFCEAVHRRIWGGEKRATAIVAAYRETMYRGEATAEDQALAPNARRLANRQDVSARLAELAQRSAVLAELDASWALVQLKRYTQFNVADYLTEPNEAGVRFFNIGSVPHEKMALLSELTLEEFTEGRGAAATDLRRTKIKGYDPIQALSLMARIAGWESPKRSEVTGKDGAPLMPEVTDEQRLEAFKAFLEKTAKQSAAA